MDWFRRNSVFAGVLLLCGGAIAAETWLVWAARERVGRQEEMLRQRKEERDRLARHSPRLDEETGRAIAADLAAVELRLGELQRALQGRSGWLPAAPTRSIDGYLALAAFGENARARAKLQRVEVRADERFGFATYAHAGPEPDLLPAVHRQRVLVEHLLESLLDAQPQSLVAVQREPPLSDAERAARDTGAAARTPGPAGSGRGGVSADFFTLDDRVRLRGPGRLGGEAFRVEFSGQTQTLRAFVNALATLRVPLIVRSVEVEPRPAGPASSPVAPALGTPAVPLVTETLSTYAVTVEFVEGLPAPSPDGP